MELGKGRAMEGEEAVPEVAPEAGAPVMENVPDERRGLRRNDDLGAKDKEESPRSTVEADCSPAPLLVPAASSR